MRWARRTAPFDPSDPGDSMISAPHTSSSCRRSTDTFEGSTTLRWYPFTRATRARPMPVLPEDGSKRMSPAVSRPSFSASSTIDSAMRSFTDPPGFWPSSLMRMRAAGLGLSALTSTRGVLPIRSRMLVTSAMERRPRDRYPASEGTTTSAAGHGGQDRDGDAVSHLGVELLEVTNVVVVDVHVHELVQRAVVGEHLPFEAGIATDEVGEHLADGRTLGDHRRSPPGMLA